MVLSYSLYSAAKQMYVVWLKPGRLNIVQHWRFLVTRVTLSVGLSSSCGPIRGGICVYVAAHLSQHVKLEVWRDAADSSYVWLRLSHVQVSRSQVYLCVCYIAPPSSTVNAGNCPYDTLQNDIVDAQNAGGCIIVCGDMNARTAEQDDYTRLADLQDFVDVPEEGAP